MVPCSSKLPISQAEAFLLDVIYCLFLDFVIGNISVNQGILNNRIDIKFLSDYTCEYFCFFRAYDLEEEHKKAKVNHSQQQKELQCKYETETSIAKQEHELTLAKVSIQEFFLFLAFFNFQLRCDDDKA